MSASTSEHSRIRRAYRWVAAIAVVLFLALTGLWYFAAHQLERNVERAIASAQRQGVEIACDNREIVGYPFRLGLSCDDVTVDVPREDFSLDGGAFRSAAQIYRPNLIVSELDAPVEIRRSGEAPIALDWSLAQASTAFWTEGLDRVSLATTEPRISIGETPVFTAASGEIHARRRDDDLDIAGRQSSARVEGLDDLPPFDVSADLTIAGAANWLSGAVSGQSALELLGGRSGTVRSLALELDGQPAGMDVSGDFSFSQGGRLSGDFELAVTAPDRLADILSKLVPEAGSIAGSIASVVPYVGRTENGRTVIRVAADDGRLSAGIIPLGTVPRLR